METTKQKSLRTLLCVFLSLVLAVTMTPLPAYANDAVAAEGEAGGNQTTASAEIAVPIPQGKTLAYTGDWQLGIDPAEGWSFACTDGEAGHFDAKAGCWKMNAGNHACTLHLDEGYVWEDGSRNDITVDWSIQAKAITAPEGLQLTANGQAQQGVSAGEGYNLSGDTEATETGSYVATATLLPNYVWDDGTTEPKQIEWSIAADEKAAKDDAVEGEGTLKDKDAESQAEEDPEVSAQALERIPIPKGGTFEEGSERLYDWAWEYSDGYGFYASCETLYIETIYSSYCDHDYYCDCYSSLIDAESASPGTHYVTFSLWDGYAWSDGTTADKTVALVINEWEQSLDIADCYIELSYESCTYNGKARKPSVYVEGDIRETYEDWYGDYEEWYYGELYEGEDYTVSYSKNINAGTATVTIEGIGDYYGTTTRTFKINKKSLSNAEVELEQDTYIANGTLREPYAYVYLGDEYLSEGIDFTVSYSNNKNVGEATITISGKRNYKGSITAKFLITPKANGWFKAGSSWYYKTQLGVARGWKTIGNVKYYFNPKNGKMATGLWNISGKKYYFDSSGAMQKNCWKSYSGSWYYLSNTGVAKSGWLSQGGTWYYLNPETKAMVTGLRKIDGKRYYFDKSGAMASNCWKPVNGDWYYFAGTGAAKSGWLSQGGTWYYLDPETKAMVTGLKKIDGKRYYFNKSGVMASNRWERINYSWYYFTSSGAAKSGWLQWGGDWYWFDSTGKGASDEGVHINGSYYFFNYDGVWIKSASKGARGWVRATDRVYYYDGDYCDCNSNLYYINSYGELLGADTGSGYYTIGNYEYYFSSNGQALWRDNYYTGETEYWTTSSCYRYYGCDGCYWSEW